MALFLLYESASGYALFEAHGLDEIGQNTEAVRNSVSDLNRFGKVVKLRSFNPFTSALDALKQCNAISEGKRRRFETRIAVLCSLLQFSISQKMLQWLKFVEELSFNVLVLVLGFYQNRIFPPLRKKNYRRNY